MTTFPTNLDTSRMKRKALVFDHTFDIPYGKLVVDYGLQKIDDQEPYFSITGEIYERTAPKRRFRTEPEICGAIHENILVLMPELKPLVDLHLSDINGIPMHAVENGWFWLRGEQTSFSGWRPDLTPIERAALYLRVTPDDLADISTKNDFIERVESFRPTWKKQANDAIAAFDL